MTHLTGRQWLVIAAAAAVLAVIFLCAAWRGSRPRGCYVWCDDCEVWCDEVDDPCDCCELELDDGEPVTGELAAVDDDEQWSRELADINRARRAGELDELDDGLDPIRRLYPEFGELSLEHTGTRRLYLDLSDDPDVIAWDARQQAARTWEIAYIGFPALHAQIAREYEAAAAECRDYYGRRLAA